MKRQTKTPHDFLASSTKIEKSLPPINGAAIEQHETASQIARKIERYLNNNGLCFRVEEAEKFEQLDKMSLADIIFTLYEPGTKEEVIKYFRKQLKIKLETF